MDRRDQQASTPPSTQPSQRYNLVNKDNIVNNSGDASNIVSKDNIVNNSGDASNIVSKDNIVNNNDNSDQDPAEGPAQALRSARASPGALRGSPAAHQIFEAQAREIREIQVRQEQLIEGQNRLLSMLRKREFLHSYSREPSPVAAPRRSEMPSGQLASSDPVARWLDLSAGTLVPTDRHLEIDHSFRRNTRSGGTLDPADHSFRRNARAGGTLVPPDRSERPEQSERTERSFRRIDSITESPERVTHNNNKVTFMENNEVIIGNSTSGITITENNEYEPLLKRRKSPNPQGRSDPHRLAPAKLGFYDGSTPVDIYLFRFENFSKFFDWSEEERLFHLAGSLTEEASNILWDDGASSSSKALIRLLKFRFGVENQREKFQIELKWRRRRPGEALQAVYQDVKRLLALAYPGESGSLLDRMAIKSFTDAFDDQFFRIKVLEKEPKTLDEALVISLRIEAIHFSGNVDKSDRVTIDGWDEGRQNRQVGVRRMRARGKRGKGRGRWNEQSIIQLEQRKNFDSVSAPRRVVQQ